MSEVARPRLTWGGTCRFERAAVADEPVVLVQIDKLRAPADERQRNLSQPAHVCNVHETGLGLVLV